MREPHFHWRRVPPVYQCVLIALAEIAAHLLIQLIIVQEAIQFLENRVGFCCQFRHQSKHIFSYVTVNQHLLSSLRSSLLFFSRLCIPPSCIPSHSSFAFTWP